MLHAEEAIEIARQILTGSAVDLQVQSKELTRKETADYLQVTMDTLRNWELNGIKRPQVQILSSRPFEYLA
jgi:DNA-binding transcriptional regulator YiaG